MARRGTRAEIEADNARRRVGPGHWRGRELAELKRCIAKKMRAVDIVKRWKGRRSRSAVVCKLMKMGVMAELRVRVPVLPEEEDAIVRLATVDRLPLSMIARRMGMKLETVQKVTRRRGVQNVSMATYEAEKRRVGFVRGWLKADRGDHGPAADEAV